MTQKIKSEELEKLEKYVIEMLFLNESAAANPSLGVAALCNVLVVMAQAQAVDKKTFVRLLLRSWDLLEEHSENEPPNDYHKEPRERTH